MQSLIESFIEQNHILFPNPEEISFWKMWIYELVQNNSSVELHSDEDIIKVIKSESPVEAKIHIVNGWIHWNFVLYSTKEFD